MSDAMDLLAGADARLLGLVDRLDPASLTASSPCAEWDVRALLSHTLQTMEMFSATLDGGPAPTEAELFGGGDNLGGDHRATARRIVERSHAAWSTVSDWNTPVTIVLGTVPAAQAIAIITYSNLIHSWDLAVAMAIGEKVEFSEAEAQLAEAVGSQLVPMMRPKGRFGPEVPAAPDATPTQRVVAFSGRTPL
ncbi:TIGR03086 family metal-binding protein [Sporichthya sp.]|uniref:TIGR03086 family metal-binding protein n=1 Tax=Sporichthya sp. TaxID=65475 RepID=UPI0017AF85EE|nr:TIGR03086 family metal-binding protein [Sporichthya sp.]MBA3743976.1 TIGR03086 family protein [Sporichthya sp.]